MPLASIRSRALKNQANTPEAAPAASKISLHQLQTKMRQKQGGFILLIGDEGAVLSLVQRGNVVRRLFALDTQPDHVAAMQELMRMHEKVPLYVLLDVIDQQYVWQTFPPVSSLGVNKMVKRRLDRDFSAEDIKGAIALGRDKSGRKEWAFLLVSIVKTPALQAWMDWFFELPNDCLGMFLVPQESQKLIGAIADAYAAPAIKEQRSKWQLLFMQTKVGGYRQVVLRDNNLVFTRITQSEDEDNVLLAAGNVEQEIQNTIDYLRRLGFTDNQEMSAYVVIADEVKAHVDMHRFGLGAAHVVSPHALAVLLGYQNAAISGDRFADVVVSCAFMQGKLGTRFFSTYGQKIYQFNAARRYIKMAAAALCVLCVLQTVGHTVQWLSSESTQQGLVEKSRGLDRQLIKAKDAVDAFGKDTNVAISIAEIYKAFFVNAPVPLDSLKQISTVLNQNTRVKDIQWALDTTVLAAQKTDPKQLPLELTITIEFTEAFEDQETYQNAVRVFTENMQKSLPRFEISSDAQTQMGAANTNLEITLDNKPENNAPAGSRIVNFKLKGLKPEQTSSLLSPAIRRNA
jgi:hypothetical protein